jgi:membrane associated rhomboid family serine protease
MLPKSVGGVLGMGAAATVSLGASGAVFGLFAVSVLVKLKFEWKRIFEVVVLGQFVMERFLNEAAMIGKVGGVGAGGVNHVAHLAGALAGVVLIALLSKILPE